MNIPRSASVLATAALVPPGGKSVPKTICAAGTSCSSDATYRAMRDGVCSWLERSGVTYVVPETLPSDLYADDCHPLTDGYAALARRVYEHPRFKEWLVRRDSK